MVTVVKNPTGHHIIDQAVTADITDASGDALVTFPYHSLGTGDFIFIDSDIEEYNGFWYVTTIDVNTFKISEYDGADFVGYEQDLEIQYYQTNPHVWSSIFLPIVYKISNDLWPVNSVDTAQTVSSFSDDNGYTNLNLSGDLKTGLNALEYVKIENAVDEDLNGVWQIVEVISNSDVTISLPYAAGNSFTGATVQYYYNNYQVKVKVYGGLNALHPWQHKKPYQEVAELSLTPDENNIVMFSIADYIKGKVAVKNNPIIGSFPLNLDAFTGFYIASGESYDISDNYALGTLETEFANDDFEGYAITGKLPFKNVYSGSYSDYVFTSGSQSRWLTNFTRLFAIEDLYFDISFIKSIRGDFQIIIDKYASDYLASTETVNYTDQGIGVYRIPIEVSSVYDTFCVRAYTPGVAASGGAPVTTLAALSAWTNKPGGQQWTLSATPDTSINGNGGISDWIVGAIPTTAGFDYEFSTQFEILVTGVSSPTLEVIWALLDASYNVIDSVTFNYTTSGVKNETFTLSSVTAATQLGLFITNNTPFDTKTVELQDATYNAPTPVDDSIGATNLTEEICIDILAACSAIESGGTSEEDFFRLLETGFFRLLEDGDRRLLEDAP